MMHAQSNHTGEKRPVITTTLRKILEHEPCGQDGDEKGWGKLLKFLGKTEPDDEPLPLPTTGSATVRYRPGRSLPARE